MSRLIAPAWIPEYEPESEAMPVTARAPATYPPPSDAHGDEDPPTAQVPDIAALEKLAVAAEEAQAPATSREPGPKSYVRVRPSPDATWDDTAGFLDAMGELQLNFTMNLLCLESSVDGVPYDPSARAAAVTLRQRIQELVDLREALNELYLGANEPRVRALFAPDGPLVAYLKGLYLFCDEATSALTAVSNQLRILQPDWLDLRARLTKASHWYFDGLASEVRAEMDQLDVRAELGEKVEEVFWAAGYAAQGLEKRFG